MDFYTAKGLCDIQNIQINQQRLREIVAVVKETVIGIERDVFYKAFGKNIWMGFTFSSGKTSILFLPFPITSHHGR